MSYKMWVMDSDICDECGGLLGDFGICEQCGWDGISEDEWEEWDEDEGQGVDDEYDLKQWAMGEYP